MSGAQGMRWAVLFFFLLSACAERPEPSDRLQLVPTTFSALNGWGQRDQEPARIAFLRSCERISKKDPGAAFHKKMVEAGPNRVWQSLCLRAQQEKIPGAFFETYFIPYRLTGAEEGLFTGYYEPLLRGALARGGAYQAPLWQKPNDLISADLGLFQEKWAGKKITGKVKEQSFVPYDTRKEIANKGLNGRALPLVWVDNSVDAFFLEIQGSGVVVLPDGQQMRVGYDGQNGHGYVPVGKVLAARGQIEKPVTMQKIRAWLEANPQKAQSLMNENPSVVFFRETKAKGAIGAQGVELTPMGSLAVDPSFIGLGTPLWLETTNHRRLVVAQDTGGAIKGGVRGDLFWGAGPEAEAGAGEMQEKGTYVVLLPREARQQ